jgi:hypothetical protein
MTFTLSWNSEDGMPRHHTTDNFTDAYHFACDKSKQNNHVIVCNTDTKEVKHFFDGRQYFPKKRTMKDFLEAYRAGTVNKIPNI